MSILIKGMEMPTSCPCEVLGIGYDLYCSFAGGIPARVKEYYECCQNGTRPSWCPLVPVPPHGRLIDADALISNHTIDKYDCSEVISVEDIRNAPAIIPAEEGET
jgi:hypothetical protein